MVVPAVLLQQLMRHASLDTTLKYYVEVEAKATIKEVRRHVDKYISQATPEVALPGGRNSGSRFINEFTAKFYRP